jgi:regulator of cell morphogenesis and NO signaling
MKNIGPRQIQHLTVAEIANEFPNALRVFHSHGIDFCCGGREPLDAACSASGVDTGVILEEILSGSESVGSDVNYSSFSTEQIINIIEEKHHRYVRAAMPEIREILTRICNVHGVADGYLWSLKNSFDMLCLDLMSHMDTEELAVFPAIRNRLKMTDNGYLQLMNGLDLPVKALEDDHEMAGQLVKRIRQITSNYTPPEHACPTFRLAYSFLKQFDADLMLHIHLENNVLFDRLRGIDRRN